MIFITKTQGGEKIFQGGLCSSCPIKHGALPAGSPRGLGDVERPGQGKRVGDGLLVRSVPAEAIRPGRIAGHGGSYLKTVRAGEVCKAVSDANLAFCREGRVDGPEGVRFLDLEQCVMGHVVCVSV